MAHDTPPSWLGIHRRGLVQGGNEYKNEFTHRLRIREIDDQVKVHENMENQLCKLKLLKSRTQARPEFTVKEIDKVIRELKDWLSW